MVASLCSNSNMASFPNTYTHRKVADTASKACEICYKPSASVLVTPENKVRYSEALISSLGYLFCSYMQDFFYICPAHLKDNGFCSPLIDKAAIAAKKKKEMEAEFERVKQEIEEKRKKKKEKGKAKEQDKDSEKDKDGKDAGKDDKKSAEKVGFSYTILQKA